MSNNNRYREAGVALDEKIEEYDRKHTALDERLDVVEDALNAGAIVGEDFDPSELQSQIDAIRTGLEENSISLVEVQNTLDTHENEITKLKTGIDDAGGDIEVDPGQLRAIVEELLPGIVQEQLADIREDMASHSDGFEFPARRVGPTTPAGDYHKASMWGIHFKVGRECYIRSARIDAMEAGSFTAQVGKFDGKSFQKVDETKVTVSNKGSQRVTLDLQVPGPGEYLLTRPGEFAMRRTAWNGWQSHLVDNLRLIGGNKPDELGGSDINTSKNQYYYYFFDCEFVANQAHELKR